MSNNATRLAIVMANHESMSNVPIIALTALATYLVDEHKVIVRPNVSAPHGLEVWPEFLNWEGMTLRCCFMPNNQAGYYDPRIGQTGGYRGLDGTEIWRNGVDP